MAKCFACPRLCGANRETELGFCGEYNHIRLTRAAPHYWEEPCISGTKGSGAVFFSGCNLKCVFCQNKQISRGQYGVSVSIERLSDIFLELQYKGVHNINLVTPTHYTVNIAKAIKIAKENGLSIPIVWNSSAYESVESLRLVNGLVDIYIPDFKYISASLSKRYSNAENYSQVARLALDEMVLQCGGAEFSNGIMQRGVIVRHLVLPGCVDDSKNVLLFLHRKYGDAIYISIMRQYTPVSDKLPDSLSRIVTDEEYQEVVEFGERIGIHQGYVQEGAAAIESFIPQFDMTGV